MIFRFCPANRAFLQKGRPKVDFTFKEVASIARILQDRVPLLPDETVSCDAIYAVSEAPDNMYTIFLRVARRYYSSVNPIPIAIAGWDHDRFGYPGCHAYRQHLEYAGVRPESIVAIPPVDLEEGNTRTEALAFAKYAREVGWQSVAVIAPTVHQPRAFLTLLKAVLEADLKIRLYNVIAPQPWSAIVTHSQGTTKGPMDELLEGEMKRIRAYNQNGHVALGEEVLQYLRWRDR